MHFDVPVFLWDDDVLEIEWGVGSELEDMVDKPARSESID